MSRSSNGVASTLSHTNDNPVQLKKGNLVPGAASYNEALETKGSDQWPPAKVR